MSAVVKVMAMLARYTLPDDVDVSVNNLVREFHLSCVDTLRAADQEHRAAIARAEAAERERDQALALLLAIEAAIPGNTYTGERNALDAVVDLVAERDHLRATLARVDDLPSYWHQHIWSEDRAACARELEAALKGPVTT